MNFPGGSICSSNRHEFSRRAYRRDMFFQGYHLFVEQTLLSHRTDTNFPKNPYLIPKHIQIFQETPMPRTHRHFPGRYPLSNRYFVNWSRWLLSNSGIDSETLALRHFICFQLYVKNKKNGIMSTTITSFTIMIPSVSVRLGSLNFNRIINFLKTSIQCFV